MKRQKTAVIGLGNRLLADEGAGPHAVDLLKSQVNHHDADTAVDILEAGAPGMSLLHQFDEREKIIFIDAGNCGLDAGEYRRFTPHEAVSLKKSKGYSLHEFDLMGFLDFAGKLGVSEKVEVVIYCMQASEVAMSESLSPVVEQGLTRLVNDVYRELTGNRQQV
jgi:hydrogenase maturation protease